MQADDPRDLEALGDPPDESLLFARMAATDGARMPLMALMDHDDAGLALVAGFIERLGEPAHR